MYILGSGSPQRQQLLQQAGYHFRVVPPRDEVERGLCSQCGPAELVIELAAAKAVDVATLLASEPATDLSETTIITCDTVAECGGQILGKPVDEEHARSMLLRLRGMRHRVYSGLCVWSPGQSERPTEQHLRLAVSHLRMDKMSEAGLEQYLDSGGWRGKAGAFGYQDGPDWLHLLEGSESNVIGLPMELLAEMIEAAGGRAEQRRDR